MVAPFHRAQVSRAVTKTLVLPVLAASTCRTRPTDPTSPVRLPEHFRLESPERRAAFPRVGREPGLPACVLEKLPAVQCPPWRDLREQQAATPVLLDDKAVAPDLDVVDVSNQLERTEDRDLDRQRVDLRPIDSGKSGIGAAGGD